jgi:hypothetical protein
VWRLYGDIFTPVVWLMCGFCMETSVHHLSDWCVGVSMVKSVHKILAWNVESVWRHLYTICQTDVRSLYGHICTPVVRLMCGVCMETSVHNISDWCVESVLNICTQVIRLICGVCMEISVHQISDWCLKPVLTHIYYSCQIDGWSL